MFVREGSEQGDRISVLDVQALCLGQTDPVRYTLTVPHQVHISEPVCVSSSHLYVLGSDFKLRSYHRLGSAMATNDLLAHVPLALRIHYSAQTIAGRAELCGDNVKLWGCIPGEPPLCFACESQTGHLLWIKAFEAFTHLQVLSVIKNIAGKRQGIGVATSAKSHGLVLLILDLETGDIVKSFPLPDFDVTRRIKCLPVDYHHRHQVDALYLYNEHYIAKYECQYNALFIRRYPRKDRKISQVLVAPHGTRDGMALWMLSKGENTSQQFLERCSDGWQDFDLKCLQSDAALAVTEAGMATLRQGLFVIGTTTGIISWDSHTHQQQNTTYSHYWHSQYPVEGEPVVIWLTRGEAERYILAPRPQGIGISQVNLDHYQLGKRSYSDTSSSSFLRISSRCVGSAD